MIYTYGELKKIYMPTSRTSCGYNDISIKLFINKLNSVDDVINISIDKKIEK